MNRPSPLSLSLARAAIGALSALLLATLAAGPALGADANSSTNYLALSGGGSNVTGDSAAYQKRYDLTKKGFGGVDGFLYQEDLGNDTTVTTDGHALFGNADYLFHLRVEKEGKAYFDVGYKAFRTWYDGSGGYFPPSNLFIAPVQQSLYIDRTNWWIAAGVSPSDDLHFNFRYDYQIRKGLTDSTSWADTTLTGGLGTRAVVPTFLRINEQRHIFNASVKKDGEKTSWDLAGRYETDRVNNDIEIHRTPGEAKTDRYVTQHTGTDSDTVLLRGSFEQRLNEQLLLTSGAAWYKIDTNLDGSRIYGVMPDPVFDPAYARRQFHDEGFHNLEGTADMRETMANLSLMYTPAKYWTIVPALKADKTTWSANSDYVEASVGAGPAFAMTTDDQNALSNKDYREVAGSLEARYTGIKDWAFNAIGETTRSDGLLNEDLYAVETGLDTIYRSTNYKTNTERAAFTADWYPRADLSFTGQYYWKGRQDSFSNTRDSVSAAPTSGDRYPGYIAHQDTATNDVNLRASWRALPTLRLVTRYDYQQSTISTQVIGLSTVDSGKLATNIISETATWNPLARWYLQGGVNVVYDQLKTPASTLTGNAGGLVVNSDNNYVNASLSTGYALDDQTDVSLEYDYYETNNYVNNSYRSTAYGASGHEHYLSVTWARRINARTQLAIKYAYADNHDETSGGNTNYHANLVYTKLTYRF